MAGPKKASPKARAAKDQAAEASADEAAMLEHCRGNLARYKIPARIEIVDALPKNSVTKTDKQRLRQLAAKRD